LSEEEQGVLSQHCSKSYSALKLFTGIAIAAQFYRKHNKSQQSNVLKNN
jgi:hypothetical protein